MNKTVSNFFLSVTHRLIRTGSHTSPSFLIHTASRIPLSFKMFSKALVIATVVALAAARFGQEGLVQAQISALSDFGSPGQAATLAGQSPGVLLGGANACDKVCDDDADSLSLEGSVAHLLLCTHEKDSSRSRH